MYIYTHTHMCVFMPSTTGGRHGAEDDDGHVRQAGRAGPRGRVPGLEGRGVPPAAHERVEAAAAVEAGGAGLGAGGAKALRGAAPHPAQGARVEDYDREDDRRHPGQRVQGLEERPRPRTHGGPPGGPAAERPGDGVRDRAAERGERLRGHPGGRGHEQLSAPPLLLALVPGDHGA